MRQIQCAHCGETTDADARFCIKCGASTEPFVRCSACQHPQPVSNRFCLQCGVELAGVQWAKAPPRAGAVVDGVWTRAPEEFVRRVDPEETRSFLGNRVMRVPAGSAGVVVVNGVVDCVLPPGQQTAVTLFGRIANFFAGRPDRTALYLVDLRPLPIPFTVRTRLAQGGRTLETQVLVTFYVERNDRERLGTFLENVVGTRTSYGALDLFQQLRPEVTAIATAVLERLSSRAEVRWEEAEAEVRREIAERVGGRWALTADVTVAPLAATTTLDLHLGAKRGMAVRACAKCAAELPAGMKFCDRCGEPQRTPAVATPPDAVLLTGDGQEIELDVIVRVRGQDDALDRGALTRALSTAVASHARGIDFAALATPPSFESLEAALREKAIQLVTAQGLELVSVAVVDVRSAAGQWLLGARADLNRARDEASVGRQWLAQRAEEIDVLELTLTQTLARQRVTRESKLGELRIELENRQRAQEIAEGHAELDVAEARRQSLRDQQTQQAERATARAERTANREDELDDMRHGIDKEDLGVDHAARMADKRLAIDAAKARHDVELASEAARKRADDATYGARAQRDVAFDDDARRARLAAEMSDRDEAREADKLRAMAELDIRMSAQEHEQKKELRAMMKDLDERRMIAMQATELAKTDGGGVAWANALSAQNEIAAASMRLEQAERHAASMRLLLDKQADRLQGIAERAMDAGAAAQRDAANTDVYRGSMDAMSRVAASRAAPPPVVAAVQAEPPAPGASATCGNCGASIRADARFCGACGQTRP